MVSRSYDGFELSEGIKYLNSTNNANLQSAFLLLSDRLHNGEHIILSVRAENGVGLMTEFSKLTVSVTSSDHADHSGLLLVQRYSCDLHYCTSECTCGTVGKTCEGTTATKMCVNIPQHKNIKKYPEIKIITRLKSQNNKHYTASTSCIAAEWILNEQKALRLIKRFEWSLGVEGQKVGVGIFDLNSEKLWHSTRLLQNITYCLPHTKSLEHGETYIVYVRVWYSFTKYKQFESQPIIVDSTAPHIRRGKNVKDSDDNCQTDYDFVTRNSRIIFCWGDVFEDPQSGIVYYIFQIGSALYGKIYF